jgi:serine/threonine protein kinase
VSSLPPNRRGLQRIVGRYAIFDEIASGGMATVHFGRLLGPVGFTRTVAIKRLHPQFAKDPEFVSMFLDEARVAARIRHMNVVPTLDVITTDGELFLVMDYVQGESLSRLWRAVGADGQGGLMPVPVAVSILSGVLQGLHAAHEAKNERGEPLGLVHRDVSPHNVLVSIDGVARVLDFGIAKAIGRVQTTREGQIKGKIAYMAPEYLNAQPVDRRSDVYAVGVILWQCLTGRRLFDADSEGLLLARVLESRPPPPSEVAASVGRELDEVTLRALARNPADRFQTARAMAIALEHCVRPATPSEVGEWVESLAGASLHRRAERMAEIESLTATQVVPDHSRTHVYDHAPGDTMGVPPPLLLGGAGFGDGAGSPEGAGPGHLPPLPEGAPRSLMPSGTPITPTREQFLMGPPRQAESTLSNTSSQLSLLSAVSGLNEVPAGFEARQRRRRVAFGVLTVVSLACAGVLTAGMMSPKRPVFRSEAVGERAIAPALPAEIASAALSPPEPAAAPPTAATATSPIAASTSAAPKVTAKPPTPVVAAPPRPQPASPAPPSTGRTRPGGSQGGGSECSPPYTIDAQGIRHPKPHCL